MADEKAVEVVSQTLKETRWTSHPFPAEYVPALARDILYALEQAGIPVGESPPTPEPLDRLAHAAEEFCLAEHGGFVCTEWPNHDGWHRVELDGNVVDTWPNEVSRG